MLSSELPNEAVWISCCSGFPRPLKGQHRTWRGPGWVTGHAGENEHRLNLNAKGSGEGLVQYFRAAPKALQEARSEVLKPEAGASELCGLVRVRGEAGRR